MPLPNSSTILVADDNPEDRLSLRHTLEAQSFLVIEASNGEDAFREAIESKPDLIVLDVGMPPDDGYAVCKRLRGEPRTKYIPILMLTCHGLVEEKTEGLYSGADDYLVKPCNNDELLARMEALFRRYPPKHRFFDRLEQAHQSILAAETFRSQVVVLNIDVHNSSGNATNVESEYRKTLLFRDYRDLVDAQVAKYRGSKPSWAGDGATTEFVDVNSAVACAIEILARRTASATLSTLILRIGIAAGDELIEPTLETGRRTSHTHNRAGHFQKHSNYNAVTIGKEVFDAVSTKSRFKSRTPIEGQDVYESR